jgi:hypothetical protein
VSTLRQLPFSWRLSRYEPALRTRDSEWESWTAHSDIGKTFNGIPLTLEEYLRVEDLYLDGATRFAIDAAAEVFEVVYVGHKDERFGVSAGQRLARSDLGPIVRANLRGDLECALLAASGTLQIEFGFDLYMRVASSFACERAVAATAGAGLYVEPDVPLALWEN